jgi:hypothetical protein
MHGSPNIELRMSYEYVWNATRKEGRVLAWKHFFRLEAHKADARIKGGEILTETVFF